MAGIAIGALAACGLVGEKTYEDDSTLSGKITSIRLDSDSAALEKKEERLFALRALARKYGVTPEGLPATVAWLAEVVAAKLSTQSDAGDPLMMLDTLRAFDAVAHEVAGISS